MPIQQYATVTPRIGKQMGEILRHSVPREVLGITGRQHEMTPNMSETVVYRRWLPYGGAATNSTTINAWSVTATAHQTQEGVTPDPDNIAPQDISVTLVEYACLYMYSNRTAQLYEDDVPREMKKQVGERMGLVREKIRYGALRGCTNKFYAGGTTRLTVDEAVTLPLLRKVTRSLMANRADLITSILSASPNFNTSSVEAAFIVFAHTDAENDIRELPGFKSVAEYGSRKPLHEMELGSCDRYRFIISPELDSVPNAGASYANTGLYSTSSSTVDIYPFIVVAEEAWGDVALRGMASFMPTSIPHSQRDKNDPLGQRGYVGAIFYSAAFVQNDGWMAVVECGVTAL